MPHPRHGTSGALPRCRWWCVVAVLLAQSWFAPPALYAQTPITFQYFYDATGQLVTVVDSTGIVIDYIYDAVGNMLEVRRSNINPTQLTIVGFAPVQGGPNSIVTINGLGFSPVPAANTVLFNGTAAVVLSSTATSLVTRVPLNATTGPLTVLVGSGSALSATAFTVLAVPVITSVSPKVMDATHPPLSLSVSGLNLSGTQFSIEPNLLPPMLGLGTPQVDPLGTSATVPVTGASGAKGTAVIVATNAFGSSDTLVGSGNSVLLINGFDDSDTDGDGFPDGLELLYGSDPGNPASKPTLTERGDLIAPAVTVVNTAVTPQTQQTVVSAAVAVVNTFVTPQTQQTVVSPSVSVVNTFVTPQSQQTVVGAAVAVVNLALPAGTALAAVSPAISVSNVLGGVPVPTDVLSEYAGTVASRPASGLSPLSVRLDALFTRRVLVEGEFVDVVADVSGGQGRAAVTFTLNGVPVFDDTVPPFVLPFQVPVGPTALTFGAVARDAAGTERAASSANQVAKDTGTVVSGRVVDDSGRPVPGAVVELLSSGVSAEFFEPAVPLAALPDLSGMVPVRSTRVTALNMRGSDGALGADPFGTGLVPDYAARFRGWLTIDRPGVYTFFLGADQGARLTVGGVTVAERAAGAPGYQERSATVTLAAGQVPFEVTSFQSTGNTELQLSYQGPGQERRAIRPAALTPLVAPFNVVTDAAGRFEIPGVPLALENVRVRVSSQGPDTPPVTAVLRLGRPLRSPNAEVGDILLGRR